MLSNKKYVSLSKLSTFLDNLKDTFSTLSHKHTLSDISDYTVDSQLSKNSTNPVQNKVLDAEFDAISDALGALELAIDGKSDSTHNHDEKYYTETEIDQKLSVKADLTHIHPYGVCSSSATYITKSVTVDNFELTEGVRVTIKFTNANKASAPKLNVNETGAIPIVQYGETSAGSNTETNGWEAGAVIAFTYDGTNWVRDYWYNTTYTNAKLGQGYGTCYTSSSVAEKEVSMTGYEDKTGGIVSIKFTYSVDAGATLNINGQGALDLYYNGSAIVDDVIKGGDVATFINSGSSYRLISVDRWHEDITELQTNDKRVRQMPASANGNFKLLLTPSFQSEDTTAYTYFDNDVYLNPYYNKLYGVDINGTATGVSGVTAGNFLVGNGTDAMTEKTPAEVLAHMGVTATAAELNYMDGVTNNVQTQLDNKVTLDTAQTITGIKTFNAPANVASTEQTTVKLKTSNGGAIIFGKEAANSGTMMRLDQVDGTCRLRFRGSATAGAMVWEQPEQGAQLYVDLGKDGADKHRITFPKSAGTLALTSQVDAKAPAYTYGTTDLTAGTSALETGKLYFVYE